MANPVEGAAPKIAAKELLCCCTVDQEEKAQNLNLLEED